MRHHTCMRYFPHSETSGKSQVQDLINNDHALSSIERWILFGKDNSAGNEEMRRKIPNDYSNAKDEGKSHMVKQSQIIQNTKPNIEN